MTTADELSQQKREDMTPLRWERVRRGLTLREVAQALGLSSHAALAHWEDGTWHLTADNRTMLARFYGCTQEVLFASHPAPPPRREKRSTPVDRPAKRLPVREPVELPEDVIPRTVSRLREKLAAIT